MTDEIGPDWRPVPRSIYSIDSDVEVIVEGDDVRRELARRVVAEIARLSETATRVLVTFMRDSGTYDLRSIEVFPRKVKGGGDFSLQYSFTPDSGSQEYGYTYFEVIFADNELPHMPFWPIRFAVGFQ